MGRLSRCCATTNVDEVGDESGDERLAVVLESDSETYLIAQGLARAKELVDAKITPTTAPMHPAPRVKSSAGEDTTPTPTLSPANEIDAQKDDQQTPVLDPQVEPQLSLTPSQPSSVPLPPENSVPQSSHAKNPAKQPQI
ncbi:hypothetical protein AZE42_09453 [Rhizopogon vesiculosus]|uniref:Uncharacterized protein n=1 Tax=Rhizopogon vesiculosus TaxID=180088 RepID=A0A1J8Q5M3_9AGAM|nr:hypothetical protein AZE42_09453 [Rhizopogon vesiculosus]